MNNLRKEFLEKGYVVLHQLFDEDEIQYCIKELYKVGESKKKKFCAIPDSVVAYAQLKEHDLYANEVNHKEMIEGVWISSSAFSFVANFFE